jgi:LysM repeat protein
MGKENRMSVALSNGKIWRIVAIAVVLAALVLPMMPATAYAASDTPAMETKSSDASWYGYSCRTYYWVEKGDQLLRIARWYGVSLHDIAAANGITNPSIIIPGQRLCIPYASTGHPGTGGCYYTVRAGDNLSRIASWYGTTWWHLANVNHLSNPRVIVPGQRLYVCG